MIRGIHHIAIHTENFDRMAEFYRAAFGFEPVGGEYNWRDEPDIDRIIGVPGSAARSVMVRAGNCYIEIFEYSAPPARDGGALKPSDRGYTHFCVAVSDFDVEFDRLAALGMRFTCDKPAAMGDFHGVYGQDPDGNVIEILEVAAGSELTLDALDRAAA